MPENFDDYESLLNEAKFYELDEMVKQLELLLVSESSSRKRKSSRFSEGSFSSKAKADEMMGEEIVYDEDSCLSGHLEMRNNKSVGVRKSSSGGSRVKILIVNQAGSKLFVSGDSGLVRKILPEIEADTFFQNQSESVYLERMALSELNVSLSLVELMERLYEHSFMLEGQALGESASTQYIFVNK